MNITFFIGNGFDLNLGLKTRYENFYEYFQRNSSEDNIIKGWINKKERLWSDLEEALGKSLSKIKENDLEKFYDDKDTMDDLLVEYLRKEQEKYNYDEEIIKKQLINSLDNFQGNLSKDEKDMIERIKTRHGGSNIWYNFVSFNYTNCLDKMIDIQKKESVTISTHTYGNNKYSTSSILENIYHIHGTVNEEMILGVNDESQINNEFLKENAEFCNGFIKTQMNKLIGQQKTEDVKNLILNSKIICLFGISMGKTDKIWWEEIFRWLLQNEENLLVIFWRDYKHLNNNKLPARTIRNNNRVKDKFLKLGNEKFGDDELELVKDRIFVKINDEDIFNFPKYEENENINEMVGLALKKSLKNNYY